MRQRILQYLENAGHPVSAEKVLREVFGIISPTTLSADRFLKSLVGRDPRFRRVRGLWTAAFESSPSSAEMPPAAALFIEMSSRDRRVCRGAVHLEGSGLTVEFRVGPDSPADGVGALGQARAKIGDRILVVWSSRELNAWKRLLITGGVPSWDGRAVCLLQLAARTVDPLPARPLPEDLAQATGLAVPDAARPTAMAKFFLALGNALMERAPGESGESWAGLHAWMAAGRQSVDFSRFAFGPEFLRRLPAAPGVYVMRSRGGDPLYVGKAANLKRRVGSYFTPRSLGDPKAGKIRERMYTIEIIPAPTELEALLIEMQCIRELRPDINLQLEVRESREGYGSPRNLLILVPHEESARADVYLLRDGEFAAQTRATLGRPASKAVRKKVRSVFFPRRRGRKPRREPWELEIVARWLARNLGKVNFVDVDAAGGPENTLRQLDAYLQDPERLARKIFYR